ncbi:MAG: hypothetical protein J1F22_01150 [Lachnospiraceae bacterium]|nr:hypothetical protein [Lachnospiraceae bacterium]
MVRKEGSITVFLALTGILIFALLGTLVETARYTACGNHAARTLRTSAEALLSEYSLPLYENYGLFFLESAGPPYETVISSYAGSTMEGAKKGTIDFFTGQINEIRVTDRTYLGDNKAEPLQKEITQYMARKVTGEQLKKILKQSEAVVNTEQQAEELEETVKRQKEEAKLDKQLLKLMKQIDGITVSGGKIYCADEFVKMFVTGKKKSQNFGITENVVWKKMKNKLEDTPKDFEYLDTEAFLAKVKKVRKLTEEAIKQAEELKSGYKKCAGKNSSFAGHDKRMGELIQSLSVLVGNKKILEETETIVKQKVTEETKEQLRVLWKNYDTASISFDYTGVEESGGGDNPLEALSGSWKDGILNLVCEKPNKLSPKKVSSPDGFARLYKEQEKKSENYGDRVTDIADKEEVGLSGILGDMGGYALDEFCLDSYIQHKFASYITGTSGWKKSLDYQWEYIASGKNTDKENLESVLNRILLIRTVINFAAIYQDSAKKSEAYTAAAAVVGFTGLEPLIRLTQTLILIVWSLVEGLVDVAGLLLERNVPVIKSTAQIKTKFPQVFQITRQAIISRAKKLKKAENQSFGYREYLLLFLAMTKQSTRLYRIMDMIQWDMRKNGYSGFQLGSCVFSFRVKGSFSFPSRFFRMVPVEKMLGRDIRSHSISCEIAAGYL